jgi:hypothetical protein
MNRGSVNRHTLFQALPPSLGIIPGTFLGAFLIGKASPDILRLITFVVLAPLVLMQAAGLRRPISNWRILGPVLGLPVGLLYGITTISGPPLALMFNNNGLVKNEFKAAMGIVRTVESTSAFVSYVTLGIFTPVVVTTSALVAPVIVVSMLAGHYLTRLVRREDFRRFTMSFDAWIIGYGLSSTLMRLGSPLGAHYAPLIAVVIADSLLLIRYFRTQRPLIIRGEASPW